MFQSQIAVEAQDMIELGGLSEIFSELSKFRNWRILDRMARRCQIRLGKVFEVTNRDWNGGAYDTDEFLYCDKTSLWTSLFE